MSGLLRCDEYGDVFVKDEEYGIEAGRCWAGLVGIERRRAFRYTRV